MPKINLDYDLKDAQDSFEAIPSDQYEAKILEAELTKSKNTGKDMIKFTWLITSGEYEGRQLFDNVVTDLQWKVKQYANLIDLESGSTLDTGDFKGIEAILDVRRLEAGEKGGMDDAPSNNIKKIIKE